MKAVGYRAAGGPEVLEDVEIPDPEVGGADLLVRVNAIAVNPVDTKIRRGGKPAEGEVKVLGWDAIGIVEAVGPDATGFAKGDRVFYAGAIDRPGCNSELHLVDHRIVGHAPGTLSDADAVALPLTSITAWELLFDRLGVLRGGGAGQSLLIVGGAGGVGSILIQLASQLTELTVIATASRPESRQWCLDLGADHVIDHGQPWAEQLAEVGDINFVAALTHTESHWKSIIEVMAPQGALAVIDDPETPLNTNAMKSKSLSLRWELMFTRSLYQTPDMDEQGKLLNEVASMIDAGTLRSTVNDVRSPINAATLREVHELLESGKAIGKTVVQGW